MRVGHQNIKSNFSNTNTFFFISEACVCSEYLEFYYDVKQKCSVRRTFMLSDLL